MFDKILEEISPGTIFITKKYQRGIKAEYYHICKNSEEIPICKCIMTSNGEEKFFSCETEVDVVDIDNLYNAIAGQSETIAELSRKLVHNNGINGDRESAG